MKALKVCLVILVILVQVLSHSYNHSVSKTEDSLFPLDSQTSFQSNNNSSGNNSGGGNNSNVSDAHCLILTNFTISQTNYVSVILVNTCNSAINYPGINASADNAGVSGIYHTWWYVINGNNASTNQSNNYSQYQAGWQLSFNQSIANGTLITIDLQATILNCGPNNSWANDCPNSNNSTISYQFQYTSPTPSLIISSVSLNSNNDRITLTYFSENYSGYVSWQYTSNNGTSLSSSYSNSYTRTTYIIPNIFGSIQICGSISGDITCVNITRNERLLHGEIDHPSNNLTTNSSSIYLHYSAENYTSGTIDINNQTFHYLPTINLNNTNNNSALVNLPVGWSTLCLRLTGDNNTSLDHCINVHRTPPTLRLIITSANLTSSNDLIYLNYMAENFSGTVQWAYDSANGISYDSSYANNYLRTAYIYPTTFGVIEICGTINNSTTECVYVYRDSRMLEGSLITPTNNSQYSTTTVQITYKANNYTNGSIIINGQFYRDLGSSFEPAFNNSVDQTSIQVGYGLSTICLELWGENSTYISDCIVVERFVPNHIVSIMYPSSGLSFTGETLDVSYALENSSSHYFTVNGVQAYSLINNTGNTVQLHVGFGTPNVCLISYDYAGIVSSDCVVVTMVNPNADSDSDGTPDNSDLCPNTNPNALTDANGCATYQLDTDSDGINDAADLCPNTQSFTNVDADGCAANQRDTDGDGVLDNTDLCSNTLINSVVDSNGCAIYQLDSDNDGVMDDIDICPGTIAASQVNSVGCASNQRDTDSDGIVDSFDQCPNTPIGTVVDLTGCDYTNANNGTSTGNNSTGGEDTNVPGFELTLAIAAICVAFFVGQSRKKESQ